MLYHLFFPLAENVSVFNVLRYISFRSVYAAVTALLVCWLLGPTLIRWLTAVRAGENVRDDGPKSHGKKAGTPTMGGLLIVAAVAASTLLWARWDSRFVWMALAGMTFYASIGFVDDFRKLRTRRGLSIRTKLILQIVGAGLFVGALAMDPAQARFPFGGGSLTAIPWTAVKIPLFKFPTDFGVLYYVFAALILVAAGNSVNFTDGLDGLAAGSALFTAIALGIVTYLVANAKLAEYLRVVEVPGASELTVFCSSLVGACLGFLWFNAHPAEVFMGDTGSLALGGSIGSLAILSKSEILLLLIGGIFVVEGASVVAQVVSFRLWGKRLLKMAPLHHHFELAGWSESKIVIRFWIIALLLSLLSLSVLKLR